MKERWRTVGMLNFVLCCREVACLRVAQILAGFRKIQSANGLHQITGVQPAEEPITGNFR